MEAVNVLSDVRALIHMDTIESPRSRPFEGREAVESIGREIRGSYQRTNHAFNGTDLEQL
jgi:hypothetical protein